MGTIELTGTDLPEKERRILEAAIEAFSEKGFSAATTSEIARNAGVAEGTIFRYFKTKKDILRGILIQAVNILSGKIVIDSIEKIMQRSENTDDMRPVLKEIIYDRIKLVDSFFPMARVVLTEALIHEDVREAVYQNIIVRALELFGNFHSKMVKKGLVREDMSPEAIFRSVLGNIAVFIGQRKLFGDRFEIRDLESELDVIIDSIMYGIAGPNQRNRRNI